MSKKLVLVLLGMALVAMAGSVTKLGVFQFTLDRPAAVNGSVLQPGQYKLVVRETTASMIAQDGRTVEAPVKIETVASKFDATAITIEVRNSKTVLSEIDLGGRKTKLLFAQ